MTTENANAGIAARGLGLLTTSGWVYREVDLDVPRGALALVTMPLIFLFKRVTAPAKTVETVH